MKSLYLTFVASLVLLISGCAGIFVDDGFGRFGENTEAIYQGHSSVAESMDAISQDLPGDQFIVLDDGDAYLFKAYVSARNVLQEDFGRLCRNMRGETSEEGVFITSHNGEIVRIDTKTAKRGYPKMFSEQFDGIVFKPINNPSYGSCLKKDDDLLFTWYSMFTADDESVESTPLSYYFVGTPAHYHDLVVKTYEEQASVRALRDAILHGEPGAAKQALEEEPDLRTPLPGQKLAPLTFALKAKEFEIADLIYDAYRGFSLKELTILARSVDERHRQMITTFAEDKGTLQGSWRSTVTRYHRAVADGERRRAQRREQRYRAARAMETIGTKVCRQNGRRRYVGYIERIEDQNIQIRVVHLQIGTPWSGYDSVEYDAEIIWAERGAGQWRPCS